MLLLTFIFLFGYAGLILFYYQSWKAVPVFQNSFNNSSIFLSVVVAARNEEEHLPSLLNALQFQSYPQDLFEVIVVDDFSTDQTAAIIKNCTSRNVRYVQPLVTSALSSKKKAIETGINLAKGELIVTTDADCCPTANWLSILSEFYIQTGASFIASPVRLRHNPSWLQVFQSLDFITLQGITAASVGSGFHTLCNGANLAYKKQTFIDVHGFKGIDHTSTGDDMLLMYKIWKMAPAKVHYLKSKEAIVTTVPMTTLKDFIMQRKRWASKTLVYEDHKVMAVLIFVYLFNCLFVALIAVSFFHTSTWWIVAAFWVIKTIIEVPFVYSVARFYEEQQLMKYFFWMQPLHIFYTVAVGFISQVGRYEWKGRRSK